jgi:hypothetical protein
LTLDVERWRTEAGVVRSTPLEREAPATVVRNRDMVEGEYGV